MSMEPLRVGLVGCGNISEIYITNAARLTDAAAEGGYRVVACCDADPVRAQAKAEAHGVRCHQDLDTLLADSEVEAVLNLTPPRAHAGVGLAAIRAGKHLYSEKPVTIEVEEADALFAEAEARGLLIGCAPDTYLGAGYTTCARLLREGAIGTPVGAVGFMMCRGPELWHPDPAFFYQRGAGPLFDMGPYYLSAMVHLFGEVRRVASVSSTPFAEREILSEPRKGERVWVETPSHVNACLEFASGVTATLVMSFDVWAHTLPHMQVYGSAGTLTAPDPNTFDGPVTLTRGEPAEAETVELDSGETDNARGLGLVRLCGAVRRGDRRDAGGELARHVLEVMHAILGAKPEGVGREEVRAV